MKRSKKPGPVHSARGKTKRVNMISRASAGGGAALVAIDPHTGAASSDDATANDIAAFLLNLRKP